MGSRAEAYVDTSALIAFTDQSDTHHPLFRRLLADPPALVTTSLVVAEGHAWFLRRFDSPKALQFLGLIEEMKPLQLAPVGAREQRAAASILRRFSDQDLTLVDAVGLHLMQEHRSRSCWSTDRHLALMGVPLVIHE